MKIKYKKELKNSNDLVIGDNIKIGGLICEITKVEDIFHYVPKAQIRLSLTVVGATPRKNKMILFLPNGTPIETLK